MAVFYSIYHIYPVVFLKPFLNPKKQKKQGDTVELDRLSGLKENLLDAGDGTFISRSDPQLWLKLLKKKPRDEKVMYHAGLSLEAEAKKNLQKYRETGMIYFSYLYRKKMAEALELLNKSWKGGYLFAGSEILRINRKKNHKPPGRFPGPWLKRALIFLFLLACFLAGAVISILFFANKNYIFREITEEYYTYMLPYEVIDGRPGNVPRMSYELETVIIDRDTGREKLVNDLVSAIKIMYERDPQTPKMVTAAYEGQSGPVEAGMALWAGKNSSIHVYLYPLEKPASPGSIVRDTGDRLVWETTTVARSALFQYARVNGRVPGNLSAVTGPFPGNYLTSLPRDPYSLNNSVNPGGRDTGGWLYTPEVPGANKESIMNALRPNLPGSEKIPFEPEYIFIDKTENSLSVLSGDTVIRKYRAALGKDGGTPEGNLFIAKKLVNPDTGPRDRKLYGTRVMELSEGDIAIHGTDSPESIGKNATKGCIRLSTPDMEDLYSIVPLYTPVIISRSQAPEVLSPPGSAVPDKPRVSAGPPGQEYLQAAAGLYDRSCSPRESAGVISFNWKG